jgi:hypothetical protein
VDRRAIVDGERDATKQEISLCITMRFPPFCSPEPRLSLFWETILGPVLGTRFRARFGPGFWISSPRSRFSSSL